MRLSIKRFHTMPSATLGLLFLDGVFFCFTLEDTAREVKVHGETRIPAGRYTIGLRDCGGMLEKYKAKFGDSHRGMLWVKDVPGFEYVYIHIGNTQADTQGCILLGNGATINPPQLMDSTSAYKGLYPLVYAAISSGEAVTLEVSDAA